MIGLSGLITPSLDEMAFVAARDGARRASRCRCSSAARRRRKAHTAVKIAPDYSRPGRARARRVARGGRRRQPAERRAARRRSCRSVRAEYEAVRVSARRPPRRRAPGAARGARAQPGRDRLGRVRAAAPTFTGVRVFDDYPLAELVQRIDWTPFFQTWELPGTTRDPRRPGGRRGGAQPVRRRAGDARPHRARASGSTARAVVGFWPANAVGDDVELYADDARTSVREHGALPAPAARQEGRRPAELLPRRLRRAEGQRRRRLRRRLRRHRRASASTRSSREFDAAHDDYGAIMAKALADRLAEAFAERLHERVRTRALGLRARTSRSTTRRSSARSTAASARRRATRRARTTPRRARCSSCSTPTAASACSSPRASRCCRPRRSAGSTSRTPQSQYFGIGQDRQRPGRGLRAPEGDPAPAGRAVALAGARLHAVALTARGAVAPSRGAIATRAGG